MSSPSAAGGLGIFNCSVEEKEGNQWKEGEKEKEEKREEKGRQERGRRRYLETAAV